MNHVQAIKAAKQIDFLHLEPTGRQPFRSLEGQFNEGISTEHLRFMIAEIEKGEMSEAKTMRWLGYIQGVMVGTSRATLTQMKELSRWAVYGDKT